MATTKLSSSQIDLFIEEARPHVTKYRNRGGLEFIGGSREAQLEQFIGVAKHVFRLVGHGGPGRVILSKLDHKAVKEILEEALWVPHNLGRNRAYGDYQTAAQYALTITTGTSAHTDRVERVQALLFAVHIARQDAKLRGQMFEAGESEIVWATIAALAEYLDLDSDVAKAIALGYNSMNDWFKQACTKCPEGDTSEADVLAAMAAIAAEGGWAL